MVEKIPIDIYFGGDFVMGPPLSYVGGDVVSRVLDIDFLCVPDMKAFPLELGYDNVHNIFYKFACEDFKELNLLESDKDILSIQNNVENGDRLQLYFEHIINTDGPLMIPLQLPAPPQHDQVEQNEAIDIVSEGDVQTEGDEGEGDQEAVDSEQQYFGDEDADMFDDGEGEQEPGANKEDGFHPASWTEIPVDDEIAGGSLEDEDDSDFRETDEEDEDDLFNPTIDEHAEEEKIKEWMGKQINKNVEDFEVEEELSEYEDSEELRSMSSEGEDDKPRRRRRYPDFNEKTDMETADLKVGMKFNTSEVFKQALKLYCLREGKDFKYKNNDKGRVSAVCMRGCGWRIWGSSTSDGQAWQIKTFHKEHNCGRHTYNTKVNFKWLAKKYIELFRDSPTFGIVPFVQLVLRDHHINITDDQAYRARNLAVTLNRGSDLEQYKLLWDYCEAIRKWNPGSTVKLKTEGHEFQRLYVCFDACRRGFVNGCRPLIGLDACFLKGGFPGQLLCAIGTDANNNMFPIAYAICESECKATWLWFMEQLISDIGTVEEHGWTFISDQQKGLMEVLRTYVSDADHRICVRHLYANFNKEFKGKTLKDALWNCARAATVHEFNNNMEELRKIDEQAYQWLLKKDPQLWSRHGFSPKVKSDMLLNNISECFNSFILKARDKPIITMLEIIRRLLMKRFKLKLEGMEKLQVQICPKIQKKLEFSKKYAVDCICHYGRGSKVEVDHCLHGKHLVDLDERTCTCRRWDLTGIPCGHACATIFFCHQLPENFVHQCYSRETFLATYAPMLHPMPRPQLWPKTQYDPILPPPFKKQPGRPKKMRRRGVDEVSNPNKVSKVGSVIRCGRCNAIGHNARKCQGVVDPARAALHAMKAQKTSERRARKKAEKKAAARAETQSKIKKKRKKQTGSHREMGGSQPNPTMPSASQGQRAMFTSQPNPNILGGSQDGGVQQ